jgi:hypothetical protein
MEVLDRPLETRLGTEFLTPCTTEHGTAVLNNASHGTRSKFNRLPLEHSGIPLREAGHADSASQRLPGNRADRGAHSRRVSSARQHSKAFHRDRRACVSAVGYSLAPAISALRSASRLRQINPLYSALRRTPPIFRR